ncbi:MAG: hypothetical protein HY520_04050 [Candidatus Aenigmarchaeota archaeon]|nr:hypothetical protein [Candidatus Aenigmarchaeota archaeon]
MVRAALFMLLVFAAIPLAQAAPVEVAVHPAEFTVHSDSSLKVELTITNNLGREEAFTITASGDRLEWRSPTTILVRIPGGESKTISEVYYVSKAQPGTYRFTLGARSYLEPGQQAHDEFFINVLPDLALTSVAADRSGEQLAITLTVDAGKDRTEEVVYEVFGPSGARVASRTHQAAIPAGQSILRAQVGFSPHLPPGTYTVKAMVGGQALSSTFPVPEIDRVVERTEVTTAFWYDTIETTIENEGNQDRAVTSQKIHPAGVPVTAMVTAPQSCADGQGGRACEYSLFVPAGEKRSIIYRYEKWPDYARMAIGGVIVLFLGVMVVSRYSRPRLSKKLVRGREMSSVVLQVRSNFSGAQDALVRDWVSPLATVVMEEFEGLRPVVRRSEAGTELIWRLGDVGSREDRLISYKIKPLVQGHLRMPPASLRYKTKGGDNVRVRSNAVYLD